MIKVILCGFFLVIGLYAITPSTQTSGVSTISHQRIAPVSNIVPSGVYSLDGWSWSG